MDEVRLKRAPRRLKKEELRLRYGSDTPEKGLVRDAYFSQREDLTSGILLYRSVPWLGRRFAGAGRILRRSLRRFWAEGSRRDGSACL